MAAAGGVEFTVSPECFDTYHKLKTKRAHKFIVFRIKDDTEVVVEYASTRKEGSEDFLKRLPGELTACGIEAEKTRERPRSPVAAISDTPPPPTPALLLCRFPTICQTLIAGLRCTIMASASVVVVRVSLSEVVPSSR